MSVEHANQNKQLTFGMTVCFNYVLSNFECLIAKHTMTGTLLEHLVCISMRNTKYFLNQFQSIFIGFIVRL